MYKKIEPRAPDFEIGQFPHCDPLILHAPAECEFCDRYVNWQALRLAWGIAFTGWTPDESKHELPCPANHARGDKCESWTGNQATRMSVGSPLMESW